MDLFKLLGTISINNEEANDAIEDTTKKGQQAESKLGKFFGGVGKGALAVGKAVGVGLMAAGTAVAGLVTSATSAYAEYEQLVGGVDTLFKSSSAKVQAYAEKAYETAGMSANEYMNTVTSFSASLLQSLGGDTEKAADKADVAIRDMSDNANKMGTSMESIQNAYQGFAKQNYTMLDNLKLGYGGTKEEMQRLLSDAEKLSGQKFDISSYADVVDAIHVVQTEMGITGTTAKEAAGTISGSMSSVKGAWQNLVTAMASDDLPLDEYITKFADSAATMVGNMLPRIQTALGGVVQLVNKLAPVIIGKIPELFSQLLPSVIQAATGLVQSIVSILPSLIDMLTNTVLPALLTGFVTIINALISALPQIIQALVSALPTLIPMLINAFVSIIVTICSQFGQIIQPIIDYLPQIIISLVNALMENLPILIEGLITLTLAIVSAIPQIIQALVDALPMVMESIIVGLFNLLPVLIQGFIDLMAGLASASDSIWSSVKQAFVNYFKGIWNGMTQVFAPVGKWFGDKFTDAKNKAANAWSDFKGKMSEKWTSVKNVFSNVGGWFKEKFNDAKEKAVNAWSNVKAKFTDIKTKIASAFSDVKEKLMKPFTEARDKIKEIADKIKGFFKGDIEMPKIKKPSFAITPEGWKIGDLLEGVIPKLSIKWNAKGAVMKEPTLFGYNPATGTFQGGGEAGDEAIAPISTLQQYISTAVASQNAGLIAILTKILDAILAMDENMGGNLRDALDGVSFDVNKREFARLVKESV